MVWEEGISALTTAGVKGATISNNHITDYGGEAALNTKEILERNGIEVIGLTNGTKHPIIFAGDISMDKPIRKGNSSSCAYNDLISNLTQYFESVDYNLVNVEAPFVTREMAKHPAFPNKGKLLS